MRPKLLINDPINPFRHAVFYEITAVLIAPRVSFLTICSDYSKPYMILKALDKSYIQESYKGGGQVLRVV